MTLIECVNLSQPIKQLMDQPLPFDLAYKVSKIAKIVDSNQTFYLKQLHDLAEEYKDPNRPEKDGEIPIREEDQDEFQTKLLELQSVQIQDQIPTITPEELSKVSLTPRQVFLLTPILSEDKQD